MKINIVFLYTLLGIGIKNCIISDKTEMLILKDRSISFTISTIIDEEGISDAKNKTLLLKINKGEFRFGILSNNVINYYLAEKKDKPVGFFKQDNMIVLVFGNDIDNYFSRSGKKRKLPYLNKKQTNHSIVPLVIEPDVEVYSYAEDGLEFINKGKFELLD